MDEHEPHSKIRKVDEKDKRILALEQLLKEKDALIEALQSNQKILLHEPDLSELNACTTSYTSEHLVESFINGSFDEYEFKKRHYRGDIRVLVECCVQLAQQLSQKTKELQEAIQMQNNVLSLLSHELRSPLNQVLASCDILEHMGMTREQAVNVTTIKEGGMVLLDNITAILDLCQLKTATSLSQSPFALGESLTNVVVLLKPKADLKGINFIADIHPGLPPYVIGDEHRLQQLLTHLLDNAIKFAPARGRVTLSATPSSAYRSPDHSDATRNTELPDGHKTALTPTSPDVVVFEISDNGIGMTEEHLRYIYVPFWQADMTLTRQYGGVGMGLPISQQIVKLFGGDITFSSSVGKGTQVKIILPLPTYADMPPSKAVSTANMDTVDNSNNNNITDNKIENKIIINNNHNHAKTTFGTKSPVYTNHQPQPFPELTASFPSKSSKDLNILVVEDNDLNMRVMRRMLANMSLNHDEAVDGAKAIQAAQAKDYHLIFMDVHMPNVDGIKATQDIRKYLHSSARPQPYIVGVTADLQPAIHARCREAGMDDFIYKPVRQDHIRRFFHLFCSDPIRKTI